jgi:hypothetical protein
MPLEDWPVWSRIAHGCLVCRRFLGAGIGQNVALGQAGAAHHQALAGSGSPTAAGNRRQPCGGAEQRGDDGEVARLVELDAEPGEMAPGNVSGLVRQHADDLVGRLGAGEQPRIDEDALAAGNEGVDAGTVDQMDPDGSRVSPAASNSGPV